MTSLMNTLKGLVFGLAVAAIPVTGFAGYSNSVSCNAAEDWKKSDLSPFACAGSFDVGTLQPATMLGLVFESFKTETGLGEWTLTGFANASSKEKLNNVFDKVQRSKSGEIKLEDKLNSTFVMALFADEKFSLYLFDSAKNPVDEFKFSTDGVALDSKGKAYKLDSVALYEFGQTVPQIDVNTPDAAVPVPAALPLFGSVLVAGGLAAWRKKKGSGNAS